MKQIFRFLVMILGGLGVVFAASSAEPLCVGSSSEFDSQKRSFPAFVQQLPAMLTTDGFFVTAGLKIRSVGDKLKLEGYVWQPGDIYADDGYIKSVCYDGSTFKVTLENGKTYDAKVKNDKSVSIQGVTFEKSSAAEFASIVEKVKKASGGKIKTAADSDGVR